MWCQPEIPLLFSSVNFLRRILHTCLKAFANKICQPPPNLVSASLLKCHVMRFSLIMFRMFSNFSWFLFSNYGIGRKWPLRCRIVIQIPQILDLLSISETSCANTPDARRHGHSQDLLLTCWCDTAHIHGSISHGYYSCNTILGYIMPDWCMCVSVFHSTIYLIHLYLYLYLYLFVYYRLLKALQAISKTLSACVALSPCNFQLDYSLVRRDFRLMLQRM